MIAGYLMSTFDLLNVSDLDAIEQARGACDELTVGVLSDDYVERVSGRRPVVPLEERTALLRHVRGVDAVLLHDQLDLGGFPLPTTIFAIVGVDYEDSDLDHVSWITPRRRTVSPALQRALAGGDDHDDEPGDQADDQHGSVERSAVA